LKPAIQRGSSKPVTGKDIVEYFERLPQTKADRPKAIPHDLYKYFVQDGMPEGMTSEDQIKWIQRRHNGLIHEVCHATYIKRALESIVSGLTSKSWEDIYERVKERFKGEP
jgi:hypothetical protein